MDKRKHHRPGYRAVEGLVDGEAPPPLFLKELIGWGKRAPAIIFSKRPGGDDIYNHVYKKFGPYKSDMHRRAVMLEVMRVLAGIEASWNWNEPYDKKNNPHPKPDEAEAGAWQVSANSMYGRDDLKQLVQQYVGSNDPEKFQEVTKSNHVFAMGYIARLLRHTCKHNGPLLASRLRDEPKRSVYTYLSEDAVDEFLMILQPPGTRPSTADQGGRAAAGATGTQ